MKTCVALALLCSLVLFNAQTEGLDAQIQAQEVCYDNYGCFSTASPWTSAARPLASLPRPPWEVGTRFVLYTRYDSPYEAVTGYELLPDKDAILDMSNFDAARPTVMLIHGFTDTCYTPWVQEAKDALLEREDLNIIAVDWALAAKGTYLRAVADTRLVGRQIVRMVDYLDAKRGVKPENISIVAHSLGAHAAGYAGNGLDGKIAKITALDPMDPYFGNTDPMIRLDPSDANFVEIVHTNGDTGLNFGLGIQKSIGHVDIYANGGKRQPECKDTLGNLLGSFIDFITFDWEGALSTWACSHSRAVEYYLATIRAPVPCVAHSCNSYSDFTNGKCYSLCDTPGACHTFGYGKTLQGASGDFHIATDASGSYCRQLTQTVARINAEQHSTDGKVTFKVHSPDGTVSETYKLFDKTVKGGESIREWSDMPAGFSVLRSETRPRLTLRYTRGGLLPITQPKTVTLDEITLTALDKGLNPITYTYPSVTLENGVDLVIQ